MDIAAAAARPLEGLTLPPLTLWIQEAPQSPAPSLEEVRAHHGIVAAAWTAFPAVLPVRFGQWFASRAELEAAVAPKVPAYVAALERVRGAGEFSIRIVDPGLVGPELKDPAEPPGATSGTAYLQAAAARARQRAAAEARGREVARALGESLGALVKEERVDAGAMPHGLVDVSHLVARAQEAQYEAAADHFGAARPELRFLRTGPWPAWSFTS